MECESYPAIVDYFLRLHFVDFVESAMISESHSNTSQTSTGLFNLGNQWLIPLVINWLDICDVEYLNIAVAAYNFRSVWLDFLSAINPKAVDEYKHSSLCWITERHVQFTRITIAESKRTEVTEWTFRGFY